MLVDLEGICFYDDIPHEGESLSNGINKRSVRAFDVDVSV